SWGIAGTSGVWGAEAAGWRVAAGRRALCSPLILARRPPAPGPAERAAAVRGSGGEDPVPLRDAVGLRRQRGVGIALDLDRLDGVALLDGVHRLQAFEHLAEHGVLAVQPVGLDVGDEELAA